SWHLAVFTHEGRVFISCGVYYHGPVHSETDCYRLILPDEYRGPEPRQYTYEGREVAYRSQVFRLGPKIVFKASDATVEEWSNLFRVLYADGAMFAAHRTYREFLDQRFLAKSENEQAARLKELAECGARSMPRTQDEMRRFLEREANPTGIGDHPRQ